MHNTARISVLEPALADRVRSGPTVQSFTQAVEACVLNSISAKAKRIVVSISPRSFGFTVEDDGQGISASKLLRLAEQPPVGVPLGGSLAALANAGRLAVSSKATSAFETCQVTLADGRVIRSGLATHQRSTQGTVVRIEDLFYSQPVRRKQMTHASLAHMAADTRERILRLAVPYQQAQVILINLDTGQTMLSLLQGRSVHSVLPLVIGAGAAQRMLPCELSDAVGPCSISGYISLPQDSHGSRAHQLLYLNKRCGTFDAGSRLINDLHQQLWGCQASGHPGSASSKSRPSSTKSFPGFLIFIRCPESLVASESDGAPSVEHDALLHLLRTAVLSAWRADIPDSFLRSAAAQPHEGARHALIAAVRGGRPHSSLSSQQPHSQAEMATASPPPNLQHAVAGKAMQCQASAPPEEEGRRPPRPGRQLISSEKRMAWHSAPARSSASAMAAVDQPSADASRQLREMTSPIGDTAVLQAARVYVADVLAPGGRTWAEIARRSLSPPMKQRLGAEERDAAARRSAVPSSAVPKQPTTQPDDVTGARRGGKLLAELLHEYGLPEQVLRPAKQPDAQATIRQHCQPADAAEMAPMAATCRAGDAGSASTAAKKRGRRGSWPPLPLAKRRAVHRIPVGSLQAAISDQAAGLQGSSSSPGGLGRQPNVAAMRRTQALPGASREVAATEATGEAGTDSVDQALGWRHRKPVGPEGASCAAMSTGMYGVLATDVPGKARPQRLSTSRIRRSEQCGKPASSPSNNGAPHPAEQPVTKESAPKSAKSRPLDTLLAAWRNPCISPDAAGRGVLQLGDLAPGLAYLTVPQAVDRASFSRARVLQQVDRKFVMMECDGMLVALDQHAADERVRLEDVRDRVLTASAACTATQLAVGAANSMANDVAHKATAAPLSIPLSKHAELLGSEAIPSSPAVGLSHSERHLYEAYRDQVERWGWKADLRAAAGFEVVAVPRILETLLTPTDLKAKAWLCKASPITVPTQVYLHELEQTAGTAPIPPAVLRVLNSKACRSAVVFGDPMSLEDCKVLISRLQSTQQCFSCAHGRPTMVPLADMRMVASLLVEPALAAKRVCGTAQLCRSLLRVLS